MRRPSRTQRGLIRCLATQPHSPNRESAIVACRRPARTRGLCVAVWSRRFSPPRRTTAEERSSAMVLEELRRLGTWEERHRRLAGRLLIVAVLTAVVDAIGTTLVYAFERRAGQTDIHSVFDAF